MGPTSDSFEPFFETSHDLLLVADADLRLTRVNPATTRVWARTGQAVEGVSLLEFVAPRDRQRVETILRGLSEGQSRSFESGLLLGNQSVRTGDWSVTREPSTGRRFVIVRDITVRRRLERELASAQKLEAVGQLASGIAHEINTPIQFIGDNLTFLADSMHELVGLLRAIAAVPEGRALLDAHPECDVDYLTEEVPRAIEQSCEGVQRVAELVRGMKEFAHRDQGELSATDINKAIEQTLVVSRGEWKYHAEVKTEFGQLPAVTCLAGAMRQVFLNLVCNAAHAIAERNAATGRMRGQITITTSEHDGLVTVAVTDDGAGMPEPVKRRLFEPFFTTKPVGRGTGQGLAISRSIVVEKHGGQLEFDSELGIGSTFRVILPVFAAHERKEHRHAA